MPKAVVNWCVIAPKSLDDLLERAVEQGASRTKSELVREAVISRLREMGFLWVRRNAD